MALVVEPKPKPPLDDSSVAMLTFDMKQVWHQNLRLTSLNLIHLTSWPIYSRKDHGISSSESRHYGEHVFEKYDFSSLPLPCSGQKEVVRRKVGQRHPLRDNLNIPPLLMSNEYPTAFGEKDKADDFIPVVSGKRGRYGRRLGQQGSNPSQLAAFRGLNGYQFSARSLKPSKIVSGDQSALHIQYSKKWDSRAGTSVPHESSVRVDTTHKSDTVFKKDDFPSLPLPCNGQKEVMRRKVGQRSPQRDNWNIPPVPLPRKVPEQCKEPESEAAVDTNDESQAGNGISAQVDKSCTAVAQCDTSPSNFSSNVPRDVDASRSGSSVYSSFCSFLSSESGALD